MEEPEEAAPEAEAQRRGGLGLVLEARVVEREARDRVAQVLVLVAVARVQPAEDHRERLAVAGDRAVGGVRGEGDRVADLGVADGLHRGGDEADLARREPVVHRERGREVPRRVHVEGLPGVDHPDAVALPQVPVAHADVGDRALVAVVMRVVDEGARGAVGVARRGRDARDDRLEDLVYPDPGFGRAGDRVRGIDGDGGLDLALGVLDVGVGQVDLVHDGDDLEPLVHRHARVGDRLGLDPLRGVHDEERALARGERARDLVGEVHVPGGVDEVELVGLAVPRGVEQAHRRHLDRDAPLALDVHRVEHLLLRGPPDGPAPLDEPVGEGGLAVVDVRDDAEVADETLVHRGPWGALQCTVRGLFVYHSCMPTKTITIEEDVYEMLKALKRGSRDSFTQVIRREVERRPAPDAPDLQSSEAMREEARPPSLEGITGEELLRLAERPGGLLGLTEEEAQALEDARRREADANPWTR